MKAFLLAISAMATVLIFTPFRPTICGEAILYQLIVYTLWILYAITGGFRLAGTKILDNKIMSFLSDISMEIYLCHMVMFRVVEKIQIDRYIQNDHLLYWTYCLIGIVLTILFSYSVKNKVFPACAETIKKIRP